jgi:hypothetical protein
MYGDIAKYFKDAYRGKCDVYVDPRRLLRIIPKIPDLLVVPTEEADLIAVEAKREADAASFSQALGRGMELREFASQVYLAFDEPILHRFQKDLETHAPKMGLLSRTSDHRILKLRRAKKQTPRTPDKAREVKEFLHVYPNYLYAEKRARIEQRKFLKSLEKESIDYEKTFDDVKDCSYDPTTNIVHVTIDDTFDDQQGTFAEKLETLDDDVQELDLKEKYGPNAQIELDSDIFSICERCGHVIAGRCRRCRRKRV